MTNPTAHQSFVCTLYDEGFVALLARDPLGPTYRVSSVSKVGATTNGSARSRNLTVRPEHIDFAGLVCPHCHVQHNLLFVRCGRCGRYGCLGATTRNTWRCTTSCGNNASIHSLGTLSDYEVTEADRPRPALLAPQITPRPEPKATEPPRPSFVKGLLMIERKP